MFDRVCLVNLKRRPDRLAQFRRQQVEKGWGLPEPTIYEAIDGNKVGVPEYYHAGGGAWGCCRSHVAILERAIMDDVGSVLVLEDDVTWMSDAWERLQQFMQAVPSDWDALWLGGQHIHQPTRLADGIVRCNNAQRTHAYAIRGAAVKSLLNVWYKANTHIDHIGGPWQRNWKVYAPDPFLFGQAGGESDISGARNPAKYWSAPSASAVVVHLTAPPDVAARLRGLGLHTGYDRGPDGLDRGLCEVAASPYPADGLRRWIETVAWEAASEEGTVATVYHPGITPELVRRVWSGTVAEISGQTVAECLAGLPSGCRLRPNYAATHIVVLRAGRDVAESLRGWGWHPGHWRDDVTGLDEGLRRIATQTHGRAAALAEWVRTIAGEAEGMAGGVACVWHPDITTEEVRAAAGERTVVEVVADDVAAAVAAFRKAVE